MLLVITLSGCNNTRQKENIPEPFSSSESSEQLYGPETLPAEETSEVETSPEPSENAKPEETQSITESESTDSSKPKAPEQTASTVSAPQGGQKQETESETAQTTPPETQTPPPAQTEAAESTEVAETTPPQEVTPEPKSIYDYEFDIAARTDFSWRRNGAYPYGRFNAGHGFVVNACYGFRRFSGRKPETQADRLCAVYAGAYRGIRRQSNSILHDLR